MKYYFQILIGYFLIFGIIFSMTGCSKPDQSILCAKPEEVTNLKESNKTLALMVVGTRDNLCFKTFEDKKPMYYKISLTEASNRLWGSYETYRRTEVRAIDSMKVTHVWTDTYTSLEELLTKAKLIACKDVPK